jgi:hypothetical protein
VPSTGQPPPLFLTLNVFLVLRWCSGTAGPVSTVARLHLNRFSSVTVLDGQLANVQRRIEGYQRDNDTIRRRVESLGDRSMLERLEGKVGAAERHA